MKKILLFLMILPNICFANTQTPATNITSTVPVPAKCLTGAANNVQTALNQLDACTGTGTGGGGTPGGQNNSVQYNSSGTFSGNGGFIYNGANVGINSASPGQTLDIQGTARISTGFIFKDVSYTGTTGTVNIVGSNSPILTSPTIAMVTGGNTANSSITMKTTTGIGTTDSFIVEGGNNGNEAAIDAMDNGTSMNVGINSTQPGETLDVYGTTRTQYFNIPTNAVNNYVLTSDSNGNGTWQASNATQWTGTVPGPIYYNSGNVGIGSTNPGDILDVDGTLRLVEGDLDISADKSIITSGTKIFTLKNDTSSIYAGYQAGNAITGNTNDNAFFGNQAGKATTSAGNTAVGWESLLTNTSGNSLTAIGDRALQNSTGSFNTAVGWQAAVANTTGSSNTAIGLQSLDENQFGSSNTAVGTGAMQSQTSSTGNSTCIGFQCLNSILTGNTDEAIGYNAGANVTGSGTNTGGVNSIYIGDSITTQGASDSNEIIIGHAAAGNGSNSTTIGNSSTTATIFPAGNVGVGSTLPVQKLDVNGTARMQGFIDTTNASQGYVMMASGSTGIGTWSPISNGGGGGSGTVSSGTIGQEAVYTGSTTVGSGNITDITNIGISSTNPGQALDVNGTVRGIALQIRGGTSSQFLKADGSTDSSTYCQSGGTGCPGSITGFANPTQSIDLSTHNGSATTAMRSDAAPSLSVSISPTWTGNHTFTPSSGNTLFTAGNIGINSAQPGQMLDVMGTARMTGFQLNLAPLTNGNVLVENNVGVGTWMPASTLSISGGSSTSGTNMLFGNGSGGFTNVSNTATDGTNVGIGSATPGQLLDVQGTTRTKNFTLSGNGAAAGFILQASSAVGMGTWVPEPSGGGSASAAGGTNAVQYNSGSSTFAGAENVFSFNGTNVGIGTTNGVNKLDVRGTVTINSFEITSAGNVGIGSAAPGVNLDVQGTIRTTGGGTVSIGTTSTAVALNVGGNIDLTNTGSGIANVNTTAGSNLTFTGGASTTSGFVLKSTSHITPNTTDYIEAIVNGNFIPFYILDNAGNWGVGVGSTSPGGTLDVEGTLRPMIVNGENNSAMNVGIGTFLPSQLLEVGAQKFDVMSVGNVGIGTINPQNLLVVNGTIQSTSIGNSQFNGNVGIGTSLAPLNLLDVAGAVSIGTTNAGYSAAPSNGLLVQGNVGIGSTVPGQMLDVAGTIRTISFTSRSSTCSAIGPVGTCWTSTGQLGYCSGAANVCSTCTAC